MRIVQCEQGSREWIEARLGIPTASCFDKILTASGALSGQSDKYMAKLLAEWFLGEPVDERESQFMERGTALEPQALAAYEFDRSVDVQRVGFCLRDDGAVGASPDGLVGDDGAVEVKTPAAQTHMLYMIGGITHEYRVQVQGQLWITGRKWCDLLAYNPVLPSVTVRFERDEEYIKTLAESVDKFIGKLEAAKDRLSDKREAWRGQIEAAALAADHAF